MAERPDAYVRKDPGDIIRSGDWNELQIRAREEIRTHTHTGGANGTQIPRLGIEPKAIDGTLIDPAADVTVNSLTTSKLTVQGSVILDEVKSLLTKVDALKSSKVDKVGDTITGNLTVQGELSVAGKSLTSSLDTKLDKSGGTITDNLTISKNLTVSGDMTVNNLRLNSERKDHINTDGVLYRYQGQCYLTVDDNFYIRATSQKDSNDGKVLSVENNNVTVSGKLTAQRITSPLWKITKLAEIANLKNTGSKMLDTKFTSSGGTILLLISLTAFSDGGEQLLKAKVSIDKVLINTLQTYTNEKNSHKSFPSASLILSDIKAGEHSIEIMLEVGKCDLNDFLNCTVIEFPF